MVDWFNIFNWIIVILFIGFLFIKYRNNFYLWNYLKKSDSIFEFIDESCFYITEFLKKLKKINFIIMINNIKKLKIREINFFECIILIIVLPILFIYKILFLVIFYFTVYPIEKIIFMKLILKDFLILLKISESLLWMIFITCFENNIELSNKIIICIIFFSLLNFKIGILTTNVFFLLCNLFMWFQRFNILLAIILLELFLIFLILYSLKYMLIKKLNFNISYFFIIIIFLSTCFSIFLFFEHIKINNSPIRVIKGNLKDLENGMIELFFKDKKEIFFVKKDENGNLYVENNMQFGNYELKETLLDKENNIFLFMRKPLNFPIPISIFEEKSDKILNGEVVINSENLRIISNNGKKLKISFKILILEIEKNVGNKLENYIFLDNSLGWKLLNNSDKIYIGKDDVRYNLSELFLFLFSILYFWLKLYGKKNSEYYNKEIINKIKNTPILLDRNKYDKFLTLSMFGLTIPNVWKIVTTKSIGEINSSIWTKIDIVYIILFSILLFCLITSKEISEYVKELEKENEKK